VLVAFPPTWHKRSPLNATYNRTPHLWVRTQAKCVPFGTPQKRRADGLGAVPRRAVSAAAAARPPLDGVFFASAAAPNGGLFPELDRQFDEIDRQFAEMNRQMDRELADVFGRTDAMVQQQRERTQQLREGALREARERTPNVAIERYEDRGDGRYMYYESIQITSGGRIGMGTLPMASAAGGASPLLLLAAVVAGAYVAVAAAFARAYERTTYRDASKWALVAGWPFLALWSKRFREQLAVALQGKEQPRAGEVSGGGEGVRKDS